MLSNSRRSSFCRKFRNKTVFWQQLESLLFGCFPFITGNHGFEMCHKYQLIFGSYQPILSYKRVGWSTYIRFYTVLSVDMAFTYSHLTLICEFVNWVQYTNIYKYYFSTNVKSYIKIYIHNNIQTEFLTEIIKCYKNDQVVEQSIQRRGCCWLFLELQENFLIHN